MKANNNVENDVVLTATLEIGVGIWDALFWIEDAAEVDTEEGLVEGGIVDEVNVDFGL